MVAQPGFFDLEDRLARLSAKGDELERLGAVVDFELFRPELERAVPRADRSKGGRPPFDHVLMFKVLILQTQNNLSDERTEFYLRDRLSWMLSRAGPGKSGAGRQHDLDFPRGADQGRRSSPCSPSSIGRCGAPAIWRCPASSWMRRSSRRPGSVTARPRSRRSRKGASPTAGRRSRPSWVRTPLWCWWRAPVSSTLIQLAAASPARSISRAHRGRCLGPRLTA